MPNPRRERNPRTGGEPPIRAVEERAEEIREETGMSHAKAHQQAYRELINEQADKWNQDA